MMLMFSNDNRCVRWRADHGHAAVQGACRLDSAVPAKVLEQANGRAPPAAIGYFLQHGGGRIKQTVSYLTPRNFSATAQCVRFLPDYNDGTFKLAGMWMKHYPDIPHLLLCDTAFFTALPHAALNYAIPYRLQRDEIKRYGRSGLSQAWILKQIKPYLGRPRAKIVSVYLGDHTHVSAIKDGQPMETSSGFTPIEGVLSLTGSGSIDPTIVFYLHASGMSFYEINALLSRHSGFSALTDGTTDLVAILNNRRDRQALAARRFYCYSVIKWIGSFISILGGIDALVFFCEQPESYGGVMADICRAFAFLGLKCNHARSTEGTILDLTAAASRIKTFCLRHDKWRMMEDLMVAALKERKA